MRILITGWTGNLGSAILARAARRWPEAEFVGIARSARAVPPAGLLDRFRVAVAGLESEPEVVRAVADAGGAGTTFDLLLHIAHVHHTPVMMRLAESGAIPRALLIHTTGMYSRYRRYSERYREIDDAVVGRTGGLPAWTILRPTMIYGNQRDYNIHKLILALSRWPAFPVFGGGRATFQPVHVDDVADAAMAALAVPVSQYRAYDVSGGTVLTYREILEMICEMLGRRPALVPVPLPLAVAVAGVGERLRSEGIGVTLEQVRRLQEDKAYSHAPATADFGYSPRAFAAGLAQEIALLRSEGMLPLSSAAVSAAEFP